MDNTYSNEPYKCETTKRFEDRAAGAISAMDLIKKVSINPNLTPESKMAQINYILLIAEGKVGKP
jgi:hypothetical protein